ncbi:hypothetical protein D9615_005246 [Tricholomella constricta]|uniref:SCP domain-containing protein n=1 Tax=Tricholomella constricta TaxID=117010 RepID=A0A8H5H673_9AGAR|nr:hypothetical protein D9615_005246 [Tricholomella constricta]
MTRLAPFLSVALLVASLPGGLAGPACSRKHFKTTDCVQKCMSKWGWTGRIMGNDPWGIVMKKADSTESFAAAISKACGSKVTPTQVPIQPVANVQSGSVSFSSTATSSFAVASSFATVVPTSSAPGVTSAAGFAPTVPKPSSSLIPSVSSSSLKPVITSSAPPPPPRTTSTPPPPPVTTSSTRSPVIRTTSTPLPPPATKKAPEQTQAPSTGGGSSGGTSNSDIQAYLSSHNTVRARHGAADLTWNDDLAAKAQQWANGCLFEHSGGIFGRLGENLAAGTGSYSIQSAVKGWTDEVTEYNPSNPKASHFTQVVWKATTQVGCAVKSCDGIFDPKFGKANYYVCEYSPAGNVAGQFAQNVQV